jgi:vacuolar protein sorting-associated protein 13A/C
VKPVTGILDLAAKTAEGIRNTTTYFDKEEVCRTRKPRLFGPEGTLIVSI